jgi:nucleoid-associated protein YgaU
VSGDRAASYERAELFDLAVARADAFLQRARRPPSSAPTESRRSADLRRALEVWALKTRFASRIDLDQLARVLAARPADPEDPAAPRPRWRGGPSGAWR